MRTSIVAILAAYSVALVRAGTLVPLNPDVAAAAEERSLLERGLSG